MRGQQIEEEATNQQCGRICRLIQHHWSGGSIWTKKRQPQESTYCWIHILAVPPVTRARLHQLSDPPHQHQHHEQHASTLRTTNDWKYGSQTIYCSKFHTSSPHAHPSVCLNAPSYWPRTCAGTVPAARMFRQGHSTDNTTDPLGRLAVAELDSTCEPP